MPLSTVLAAALDLVENTDLSLAERLRALRVVRVFVEYGALDPPDLAALDDAARRCEADPHVGLVLRGHRDTALRAHGVVPLRGTRRGPDTAADDDAPRTGALPARAVVTQLFEGIAERADRGERYVGQPTGIAPLDEVTGGLRRGALYAFVGPDDAPLDAALLTVAYAACDEEAATLGPVVVRSHTVTASRLATRLLVARAEIQEKDLLAGRLAPSEWRRLTHMAAEIADLPLRIEGWPCSDALLDVASCAVSFEPSAPGQASVSTLVNRHGPALRARIAYDPESGVVGPGEIEV